jgi:hypothetical protein
LGRYKSYAGADGIEVNQGLEVLLLMRIRIGEEAAALGDEFSIERLTFGFDGFPVCEAKLISLR